MVDDDYKDKFAEKYRIKSTCLPHWNYSTPGYYFITICTLNQNKFLGKIVNEKIILSRKGSIVKEELLKTFEIRKNVVLDEYIIMPNHIHLLIKILLNNPVETHRVRLFSNSKSHFKINNNQFINFNNHQHLNFLNKTCFNDSKIIENININRDAHNASLQKISIKSKEVIPNIIKLFKSSVSSRCKKESLFFAWQSRYHDEIIKTRKQYFAIKQYIKNNPKKWDKDEYNL